MTRIDGGWLKNSETQRVMDMLSSAGHQACFVGGCVRNALLGVGVADIDIATDARPEQVMELAKSAGLKAIPTGIEHGTVTVMSGHMAHEITTFRRDIQTDGRRALVSYSDNMNDDARRRDFTMNALYADKDGLVFDPLGGMDDLNARRVRFIDDADARIQEDYLRSLRFFRFCAWYGDPGSGMDAEALAAIAGNLDGLEGLSKERIGSELKKLLSADDPAPAMAAMEATGVLAQILPGATARYLAALIHLEDGLAPNPLRRLAALGGTGIKQALRLSRQDDMRLTLLRKLLAADTPVAELGYRNGADIAIDVTLLRAALMEHPCPVGYRELARQGAAQVFPVRSADLMPAFTGKALGRKLTDLETRWIHSGFELTRSQLLT